MKPTARTSAVEAAARAQLWRAAAGGQLPLWITEGPIWQLVARGLMRCHCATRRRGAAVPLRHTGTTPGRSVCAWSRCVLAGRCEVYRADCATSCTPPAEQAAP